MSKPGEKYTKNTPVWRKLAFADCNLFEVKKFEHSNLKRPIKKGNVDSIPEDIQAGLDCNITGKVVLSRASFACHYMKIDSLMSTMSITFLADLQRTYANFGIKFDGLPLRRSRI